jgi:hypothetical protein
MTSRREFFQQATRTAVAAMLASNHGAAAEQNDTQHATPRRGLSLQDLQQRFVDLRFGMFVHFNMATFQDREWGDPTSPADLFRPTALDTDQKFQVPGFLGTLRWSPDGKALHYVLTSNGASNIWEQSLSALKPKQLTHFNSGEIFDFSWTANHEHLLMTRGQSKRDVILLTQLGSK